MKWRDLKILWDKEKGWRNLWFADTRDAILFFIVVFLIIAYKVDTSQYEEVFENPCEYCYACNNELGYVLVGGDSAARDTAMEVKEVSVWDSYGTSGRRNESGNGQ